MVEKKEERLKGSYQHEGVKKKLGNVFVHRCVYMHMHL